MERQRQRDRLPRNFITQTFSGAAYPLRGLRFIRRHRLWGLAALPIVVNVVLLVALGALSYVLVSPYVESLEAWFAGWSTGVEMAWVQALVRWAGWLVVAVAWLVIVLANAVVLLLVGQAVAGPFLDILSERVEEIALGTPSTPSSLGRMFAGFAVALADLFWSLVLWVGLHIPILMLGVLPVIGAAASGALSFMVTAWLFSQEFVGLSMARHLVSYRARWREIMAHKWFALGFGGATMFLLLVPGLNLLLLPLAAVGGTLLFCDLQAAGRLRFMPREADVVD